MLIDACLLGTYANTQLGGRSRQIPSSGGIVGKAGGLRGFEGVGALPASQNPHPDVCVCVSKNTGSESRERTMTKQ